MLRNRAAGRLILTFFCAFGAWMIVYGALSQGRDVRPSAVTRAEGLAAWEQVYSVLIHPRCINCHTATDYPQQGDKRQRHFANVVRGPEGKGVPGGHNWHLAPLSMKWQDQSDKPLSSAAVCRAVTDRTKNHNLDGQGLLKHHAEEALVHWAWQPGRRPDGTMRALPPLTHEQFVAATRRWVEAGTPCPPVR